MKNFLNMALILALTTVTQTAYTSEITAIYATGDVLTAATLDTIKNGVNDNNTRITAIEAAPPEDGADGTNGTDGISGTNGTNGTNGADGTNGTNGTDGTNGTNGTDGVAGNDGSDGVNAAGPYINTRAPISSDDVISTFLKGAIWVDTVGEEAYILIDNASSSAIWKQITPLVYALGDTGPGGGLVFYVTADGIHGLEVTPVDSASSVWGCLDTDIARAERTAIGTGQHNTMEILHLCSDGNSAAQVTTNYIANGYYDWFLPSKDELNQIFCVLGNSALYRFTCSGLANTLNVGAFDTANYWSSSQSQTGGYASEQSFSTGAQGVATQKSVELGVRAVRKF